MGWRRSEQEARGLLSEAGCRVDVQHVGEVAEKLSPEVPQPPVVGSELGLECRPGD
jgi:hypothetical protein